MAATVGTGFSVPVVPPFTARVGLSPPGVPDVGDRERNPRGGWLRIPATGLCIRRSLKGGRVENHLIGLDAAIAVTGLSKRTLWRRIAEGVVRKAPSGSGIAAASLLMEDVLMLSGLDLDADDVRLLVEADQGAAGAQTAMGQRFFLLQRYSAAIYWFERAAEQGEADAMQCLGQCHAAGYGVLRDEHLALMWIAKAAAHGHAIARRQMAELQGRGRLA